MSLRENLTEEQLNLILEALEEKEKRHYGWAESTRKSGYGPGSQKATTISKMEGHTDKAEECHALACYLSEEFN